MSACALPMRLPIQRDLPSNELEGVFLRVEVLHGHPDDIRACQLQRSQDERSVVRKAIR